MLKETFYRLFCVIGGTGIYNVTYWCRDPSPPNPWPTSTFVDTEVWKIRGGQRNYTARFTPCALHLLEEYNMGARGHSCHMRLRRWCGTVNGSEEVIHACWQRISGFAVGAHRIKLLAAQLERGVENQRLHIQWYAEFSSGVTPDNLTSLFGCPVHHIAPDGDRQSNIDYCSKPETRVDGPLLLGVPTGPTQGRRTDLHRLQALLRERTPVLQIWELEFATMAKYHRAVTTYCAIRDAAAQPSCESTGLVTVHVFWGLTGTGKSFRAHREAEASDRNFTKPTFPERGQQYWFDGHTCGNNFVLDEYAGEYPLSFFKRFLDRYRVSLPYKGGFVERGDGVTIWITSQRSPDDWYPEASQEDRDALRRRYTSVTHFSQPFTLTSQ